MLHGLSTPAHFHNSIYDLSLAAAKNKPPWSRACRRIDLAAFFTIVVPYF
jgi:hypothetical protein